MGDLWEAIWSSGEIPELLYYGKRWQAMDVVIAQATSKRECEGEIGQDRPELPKDCEKLRKIAKDSAFFFQRGGIRAPFCSHKQFSL